MLAIKTGVGSQAPPDHDSSAVAALVHEGKQHLQRHDPHTAAALFKKACTLDQKSTDAALNYALALLVLGKKLESIQIVRNIIATGKRHPHVLFLLAHSLTEYGIQQESESHLTEAVHYYTEILSSQQDDAKSWSNLGMCLLYLHKLEEAERCFMKSIRLDGNNAAYYNNIALVARLKYLPELSAACCRKALELKQDYAEAYNNLGNALKDTNDLDGAIAAYEKAVAIRPAADFRCNLAMALLARGDFKPGWDIFEYREKAFERKSSRASPPRPQWKGENGHGKTLFIYSEQGFGDTIQFCRYAVLAKDRGFRVLLQVQKPLTRLMKSLQGIDAIVTSGQIHDFDVQCPMMSLPLAFQTDLDSIPAPGPYLFASDEDVLFWKSKMAAITGFRIGLVWSGQNRRQFSDFGLSHKQRSMPAESFLPLMDLEGVHLFNLQKDGPPPPATLKMTNYMDACRDFADTAALIMNLDLVITVDTAVAHLAGALGRPAWVLNRFSGCWRWLRGRDDTPWYPTMRLFTQTAPMDWVGVVDRVKQALEKKLDDRG
ncbi:tetratricopeptide repeat protein [Solidesulfovibrio sp.]|uniref:tetratricopeptide repeat protein n=1 Tax=Solidesulfovibrio sp. TaxID=2910990 RepID=UPI00260C6020|nr:tetratricopeptide repeat protein [Solidesulfovibrio sp.]